MLTDRAILDRARELLQEGWTNPEPCDNGPYCPACLTAAAHLDLAFVSGERRFDMRILHRARNLVRLRSPADGVQLTREQALAALALAIEDAS